MVGVQAATTDYDPALVMQKRGQIGGIKVQGVDRIEEAMKDLAAGRITAVMKVAPVAAKRPDLNILAQVPDDWGFVFTAFAIHRSSFQRYA